MEENNQVKDLCNCDLLQSLWYEAKLAEQQGEQVSSAVQLRVEALLQDMTILDVDIMKCRFNLCGELFVLEEASFLFSLTTNRK